MHKAAQDRLLCLAPHVHELITVIASAIATASAAATATAVATESAIAITIATANPIAIVIAVLTTPVMLASTDRKDQC